MKIGNFNISSPLVVFFSSRSNNTKRFVEKLSCPSLQIPLDGSPLKVTENYILIVPTYAGGKGDIKGAVPKQVIHFLNDKRNRGFCQGVIGSGNTNFGDTFALAGQLIAKKLQVPLLHQFELLGTKYDVDLVKNYLKTTEKGKE
ncbi:class Ib ribonucleoside-diphosphate reductase assembly flavoprotein NrdI [Streptococcus catagoni]|uniref:class Ib ribonucleoside-diphosphate reductase assembly flavoprotein NrdI n=1 Tax=Streptococcus catagoni TaxID=2654874 RepID=UPI001409A72D|nr:class Ib ribonucleoside-diphosphate reductase assembly flavoprotein NrdI [Streptococcus catagoni]